MEYAVYLNKLLNCDFVELDHQQGIFNRTGMFGFTQITLSKVFLKVFVFFCLVENCERITLPLLKHVVELPPSNFEPLEKKFILDKFIDDLENKLRMYRQKKGALLAESITELCIILHVC